jgi:hypothetical protein
MNCPVCFAREQPHVAGSANCSAADVAIGQLNDARNWMLKMAREAEQKGRILNALDLESCAEIIEDAVSRLRQNESSSATDTTK